MNETTTCSRCGGPIAQREFRNLTGDVFVRWGRTDQVSIGCPATNSHTYCRPIALRTLGVQA